jgi:aspartate aminotransferase
MSVSKKIDHIKESQTTAMTSLSMKLKSEGKDIVNLSAGEPDFPTPRNIKDAAIKAIRDNFTKYTQVEGTTELREAVAEKFRRENGMEVDLPNILISSGGKQSIFNALQAICNPGDEVIIPSPYWVSYPEMVKLVDAIPVILRTREDKGFTFSVEDVASVLSKKTKAMIINTPSNPTGSMLDEATLRGISSLSDQHNFYIISDEVYEKIIYDGHKHFSIGSIPDIRDRVITTSSVSKAYSMTGWRIGFMAASEVIIKNATKIQSQTTSNPSSISQAAALEAIRGPQVEIEKMRLAFQRRRDIMLNKLSRIEGLVTMKPSGAFYLFPSIRKFLGKKHDTGELKSSLDVAQYLLTKGRVALVPGGAFGSDDHIRISYACSDRELVEAADRISNALGNLR